MIGRIVFSFCVLQLGCQAFATQSDRVDVKKLQPTKVMLASQPLSVTQRRTTNSQIYLTNLNGTITRQKQAQSRVSDLLTLVELYRYRYGIMGVARDLRLAANALDKAMELDANNPDIMYLQAQRYFAAAHERLPQYFLATEHPAETELLLGNALRAVSLYQQVSEQTKNPLFYLGLVKAQHALSNLAAAEQAQVLAQSGFDKWLEEKNWPRLQHSVEYFFNVNGTCKTVATLIVC